MARILVPDCPGVYRDEKNSFWVRPTVAGRRTWHKLKAIKLGFAVTEAAEKLRAHAEFESGERKDSPFTESENSFRRVSMLYLKAGCPHTRKKLPRNERFCAGERHRIEWLNRFFGDMEPDAIKLPLLEKHAQWRRPQITHKAEWSTGDRVIELEWVTLSNVISFAVYHGLADFNHIRQQRPILRVDDPESTTASKIRHSREVAPRHADDVHAVGAELLSRPISQPTGWLWLFACLTGLRRSELLALRMDAKAPAHADGIGEPGHVDDRRLHCRRGKRSKIHWVLLHPELSALLSAHFRWHRGFAPDSPWYFPSPDDHRNALHKDAICSRLPIVCQRLKLPQFTVHGARSYFATVLRSQGRGDAEVAARVGDSTVELIANTYGNIPGNWSGGNALTFLPSDGKLPAWEPWSAIKDAPTATPAPESALP